MPGWESLLGLLLLAQEAPVDTATGPDTLVAPYFHTDFSYYFLRSTQGIKDTAAIHRDYVFLSRVYKQVPLDTFGIMPLSRYLSERVSYRRRQWLVDALIAENKEESQQNQGLIPDVEIPVQMPGRLAFLGEGGKLEIDGQNSLTVGGRGDYPILPETTRASRDYGMGTPFSLEMDQTMQIRLTGTVGTKIKVLIDHDSERMNQAKNQVVIKYEGEEDEFVQLLEAGDTKAEFPSTQYASFPGGSRTGLFGVKGVFKMGGLTTTLLAVRDRGTRESKQFTGGAEMVTETLTAEQYISRKVFSLGINPSTDTILGLAVYLDDNILSNNLQLQAKPGIIYYEGDQTSPMKETGMFHLLRPEKGEYTYFQDRSDLGWIQLTNALSKGQRLGVYMVIKRGQNTIQIGDISGDTLRLKMICPGAFPDSIDWHTASPETLKVWNYEFKNIYYIGSDMSRQPLKVTIFREEGRKENNPIGDSGRGPYIAVLGLDRDTNGFVEEMTMINGVPIRLVDYREGLLIFPDSMPFTSDSLLVPDTTVYYKRQWNPSDERKYKIVVQYTRKVDQIFLAPDIQEGSVVVKVGGQEVPQSAYRVDYNMGFLYILDDSYFSDPNAVIDISYDVIPTFSLTQRSLLGLRTDYEYSDNITIGSSLIMSTEATAQIRPRIDEVPKRAAVAEADIQGEFYYDWLTHGLDRLPLISTDKDSKLSLQAEVARSFPNPNTSGEAYLDDMESIRDSRTLSTTRYDWKYGSVPPGKDTSGYVSRVVWYNPRHKFKRGDIYPNLPADEADDYEENVLGIVLEPKTSNPSLNWASFNHLVAKSGDNYSTMEFIELYVKGESAVLHIDLGYDIPEDAPRRGKDGKIRGLDTLNNEDRNGDGIFDAGSEDTGLDGEWGNDSQWTGASADDGNDDYDPYDESRMIGTERNSKWDSEDLDQDNLMNTSSNYYSWTIDLDTTEYLSMYNGWKYYKIPLRDSSRYERYGSPSFDLIRYARLWIEGFSEADTIWIAKMDVTGNQWFSQGTTVDSSGLPINSPERFRTSYVNNKEHAAYYTPPPGARIMETAPGKFEQEGSLALTYESLLPGHAGLSKKGIAYGKHNLLDYQGVAFWVKPNPTTSAPYPTVIFRMGTDSLNFYEYRYRITSPDWQEVRFSLDSLTRFKKAIQDSLGDTVTGYYRQGNFGFRGRPNIGEISFYWFGVYNQENARISGEIWVDELRAIDPHTEGGNAYRAQASLQMADVASADLSVSKEEADFQGLSDASRRTSTSSNATYSATFNADKLFPKAWGMSMPIRFQGTSGYSLPKYSTGGDALLSPEESYEQRTLSGSEAYSASWSKRGSANRFLKWFVDPIKIQANSNKSYSTNIASTSTTNSQSLSGSYSYTPYIQNPPKILGKQLRYLPSSYSFNYTITDNWQYQYQKTTGNIIANDKRTQATYGGDISWTPIDNISGRYSLTKEVDYRADTLFGGPKGFSFPWSRPLYGWEAGHDENLSGSYNITFFQGFIAPRVSYSSRYSEDHSANKQIEDTLGNLVDIRDVNASTTTDLTISNRLLSSFFGLGAKLAPKDSGGQANLLDKVSRGLGNTTLGYTFTRNALFGGLLGRPGWMFRYGFTEDPGWPSYIQTSSNITESNSFNLSQGFNFANLSVRSSWALGFTRNKAPTSATWARNLTNPQINATLSNLNFILPPEYQKQVTSASLSSGFTQKFGWTELLPDKILTQNTIETSFSPLAQLNMNLRSGTSITASYNTRTSITVNHLPYLQKDSTQSNSLSLNLSHTFQSFGGLKFPWAEGRILKLESELRLSFKYSLSITRSYLIPWDDTTGGWHDLTDEDKPYSGTKTMSYGIDGTYKFSSSVTGTVSFTNDETLNLATNTGFKTMKLLFTVNFVF
ncbi:MAG: hypothetical protein ABIM19_02245 [candidate division WOR-3 bacterium]